MLAETLPVQFEKAGTMFRLLGLHLLEDFRGGRKFGAQPIGEVSENARILFFERDRECENLPFRQVSEPLGHVLFRIVRDREERHLDL